MSFFVVDRRADLSLCSALFTVLHDATHYLRDLRGQELAERAKYAELIMKVRVAQLLDERPPLTVSPLRSACGRSPRQSRRVSRAARWPPLVSCATSTISSRRSHRRSGVDGQATMFPWPTCPCAPSRPSYSKWSASMARRSLTSSTRSTRRRTRSSTSTFYDSAATRRLPVQQEELVGVAPTRSRRRQRWRDSRPRDRWLR